MNGKDRAYRDLATSDGDSMRSTTDTRTVQTVHGDVDYETVECASCGTDTLQRVAKRFVMGEQVDRNHWSHRNVIRIEFDDHTIREGWACEYCYESGPAGYPNSRLGVLVDVPRSFLYLGVAVALALVALSGAVIGGTVGILLANISGISAVVATVASIVSIVETLGIS